MKYHFIRSEVQTGVVKLVFIESEMNIADVYIYETCIVCETEETCKSQSLV